MNNTSKYYSTQRPISPGTYPSGKKIREIVSFFSRRFVEEIGRMAWGYIIFEEPISEKEATDYELVKAPDK